jgi:formate/nitrite transporter FocA (FNT family)
MSADKAALAEKYPTQVAAWKEFYVKDASDDAFEETHFESMAAGFFIALGVLGDSGTGEAFYDALMLAYYAEEL